MPAAPAADTPPHWLGIDLRWLYAELLQGILRRTRCPHHASDVLHDALLRYAVNALRGRIEQPHAYLRRVVDTVLVDHFRRDSQWVPLPDSAEERSRLQAGSFVPSAETLADMRQRLALMQVVLEGLPPRCREVFWLLRVEGQTQPEIAARLGLSLKTVEGHVTRALLQLGGLKAGYLGD